MNKSIGSGLATVALTLMTLFHASLASAVDYVLDQTTCEVDFGGTWTAGPPQICHLVNFSVGAADTFTVASLMTLSTSGAGMINGSLVIASDGFMDNVQQLDNYGVLDVSGHLRNFATISNAHNMFIREPGLLSNYLQLDNLANALLNNRGALDTLAGTTQNQVGGRLINYGSMDVTLAGKFSNQGILHNHGLIEVDDTDSELSNSGVDALLLNSGTDALISVLDVDAKARNSDQALWQNNADATIRIQMGAMINSSQGRLLNHGRIELLTELASLDNVGLSTVLDNLDGAVIDSLGEIANTEAELDNRGGHLVNRLEFVNGASGLLRNRQNGFIGNEGVLENWNSGTIRNRANIVNTGVIRNACAASFENFSSGTVVNTGAAVFNNMGGSLVNSGFFFLPATFSGCTNLP